MLAIHLQQIIDVCCVQDSFASVLNMSIDALLYEIGERKTGQTIQQVHIVQILISFVETDDQLLASATIRFLIASATFDLIHHFNICQSNLEFMFTQ